MNADAVQSQEKTQQPIANGSFEHDITPVTLPGGTVATNDCPAPARRSTASPRSSRPSGATAASPPATPAHSTTAPRRS